MHLIGPILRISHDATFEKVMNFVTRQLIEPFDGRRTIVSDTDRFFTSTAFNNSMVSRNLECNTVLSYAPIMNSFDALVVSTIINFVYFYLEQRGGNIERRLSVLMICYLPFPLHIWYSPYGLIDTKLPRIFALLDTRYL